MLFKLLLPVFFYVFLQCQAINEIKMVYVISGHTYYSSNLMNDTTKWKTLMETTDMNVIPKEQKNVMYKLGKKLRSMYGRELQNKYHSHIYTMHTLESPVSMMTGLLINAGIWPPMEDQIWNDEDLRWQPVPYEYKKLDQDEVLAGILCPSFQLAVKEASNIIRSNKTDKIFHNVIKKIQSEYSELKIKTRLDLLQLYYVFRSMEMNTVRLPTNVRTIYENQTFVSLAWEAYKDLTETPLQKQLNGGTFLKKLLNDFEDLMSNKATKRMTVYSGEEINIVGILAGLEGQFHINEHIPLALIFELIHDSKSKSYKIVIKSQDKNLTEMPKVLSIHGCEMNNCTFKHFKKAIAALIPEDEVQLCGRKDNHNVVDASGSGQVAPDAKPRNFASKSTFSFLLLFVTIAVTTFVLFK